MLNHKPVFISKTNVALYFVVLLLYVLLSELIYSLLGFLFFPQNFYYNLHQAMINFGIIFYINFLLERWLDTSYPWSENPGKRFLLQSAILAFGSPLLIALLGLTMIYLWVSIFNPIIFIQWRLIFINYLIAAFVLHTNVAVSFARYFIEQWQQSKIQKATFDKEKAQFNLELLRNQINPHFLFNNLNTLSALIYDDQDKASGFVRMLSRVYRNILEYRNKETVSLEEELSFFENYMELLSIRFKDMIKVDLQINPGQLKKRMIPLTLQLLIENAIKHNVVSKQEPLEIKIQTLNDSLRVSNPIRKKESLDYSSGLGLKIISNRYAFLSERPFKIVDDGQYFTLEIPLL